MTAENMGSSFYLKTWIHFLLFDCIGMRRRGGDKEKRPLNIDRALTRLLSHMENVHIKSKHIIFALKAVSLKKVQFSYLRTKQANYIKGR